jgi:hypothetical protein
LTVCDAGIGVERWQASLSQRGEDGCTVCVVVKEDFPGEIRSVKGKGLIFRVKLVQEGEEFTKGSREWRTE